MNIEHISVSRSGVWETCQQQYKYKYHLRTPSPEPEKPYFLYGKVVHKIIEEYTIHKGKKDIREIKQGVLSGKILLENNQSSAPVLEKSYAQKLDKHLKSFVIFNKRIGFDGYCEWRFKYDLNPPNKKFVYGFIDRLICTENKIFIIDYKTTKKSRWRTNQSNVIYDLQLQCYALVASKHFNIAPKNIKAGLYFLEGDELVGASFSEKTLEKARVKLLNIYSEIEFTKPEHAIANIGNHCTRCDFKSICPFFKLL